MMRNSKVALLTGFPSGLIARRLLNKLLVAQRDIRVLCLTPESSLRRAQELLAALSEPDKQRVELLRGSVAAMDFGLSGARFLALAKEVDIIHHCAAIDHPGVSRHLTERINVNGTGEVLELAALSTGLQQFVYWSTAFVAGARRGLVMEDELIRTPSFRNLVEETRFRAEKIVRHAMSRVPTVILRPAIVVGDAESWHIDRLNGPYLLLKFILNAPFEMTIPLPQKGEFLLNQVPVGYVVDAAVAIANDPRSVGRCFHLVDPNPPRIRDICLATAKLARRPLTIGELPSGLANVLLQAPGIKQLSDIPRTYLDQLSSDVAYNRTNTRELLQGTSIECPNVTSYLQPLVDYLRSAKNVSADQDEENPGV
ncbi:MAG: SDR family oxidoreductase [Deltaproteobacteria bacterium]|nr:SDR family oxidoreductase [Deltaproteobacteria bacterium]